MGQRAKLKQARRDMKAAFIAASEDRKAVLLKALEQGPLSQPKVMQILGVDAKRKTITIGHGPPAAESATDRWTERWKGAGR